MAENYRIEKEPRFGLDRVIIGPGVCHTIPPEAASTVKHLELLEQLDGAYLAGQADERNKAPRDLTGPELDLLKLVLPDGYTFRTVEGKRYRWQVLDEEGEVYVQGISTTAGGAVLELMEATRKRGVHEGRYAAQREVRVALGLEEQMKQMRDDYTEQMDRLQKLLP